MGLCVAYGCNTESGVHRISMFRFSKDKTLRKKWIQRLNRGKSATRNFAPNAHSKLCMKHFEGDQFVISPSLMAKIGFSGVGRVRLKPGAVPTIFEVPGKIDSKDRYCILYFITIKEPLKKPARGDRKLTT